MSGYRIDDQPMTLWDTDNRMSIIAISSIGLAVASLVSGWLFHGLLLFLAAGMVCAAILELRAWLIESDLVFVPSILIGIGLLIGASLARG